jgi:dephospho-CoA kinase
VKLVGLTGGIGSGKSTVSRLLIERGAVIVDADAIVKDLQAAGQPVFNAIVERFGPTVVGADGELDRPALAAIVFGDPEMLKELNAIVHPAVRAEIIRQSEVEVDTDKVVVLDVPLMVEGIRYGSSGMIVVDLPVDVAVERLVSQRGFTEADARARMARQATREERLAQADRVVDNSGTSAELEAQMPGLWAWIQTLPDHVIGQKPTATAGF